MDGVVRCVKRLQEKVSQHPSNLKREIGREKHARQVPSSTLNVPRRKRTIRTKLSKSHRVRRSLQSRRRGLLARRPKLGTHRLTRLLPRQLRLRHSNQHLLRGGVRLTLALGGIMLDRLARQGELTFPGVYPCFHEVGLFEGVGSEGEDLVKVGESGGVAVHGEVGCGSFVVQQVV